MRALPLWVVLTSVVTAVLIFTIGERRQVLRVVVNLAGALVKLALVGAMLLLVWAGAELEFRVPLLPGLDFVLKADALSLLFATLSALLWFLTTVYAIGYLERSPNRARFFGFFSLCVAATMGVSCAGNLFTFFLFYELLTLATWPLIVHRGTDAGIAGGRTYLIYTMSGSSVFLVGLVWLHVVSGGHDFILGGTIGEVVDGRANTLRAIFLLLMAGLGVKAALVPLHGWLPAAMVAPAPVSALLHAVAVVKAGAFGLVRIVQDVFGPDLSAALGMRQTLAVLTGITIIYGSLRALAQSDLKRRLAWSTVSQVSYIGLGVAVGGPLALAGGLVHLVHQGLMKVTLFFCAGNYAEQLGIHRVEDLDGTGRIMPCTGVAFSVAALGMIGLPPTAGFVSKWYLGVGALAMEQTWVLIVLIASTLLNACYFLPLLRRIWFEPAPERWPDAQTLSAPAVWALTGPTILCALLSLGVGVFAGLPLSPLGWVQIIVARS